MEFTTMSKIAPLIAGCVVFVATMVGWLIAETHGVDSEPIFYVAAPVISTLFLAPGINKAVEASTEAARNTNGVLDSRVQAAVTSALAHRDAARTHQAEQDAANVGVEGK